MKNTLFLVCTLFFNLNLFATVHTVTSPLLTFAPNSLVIVQGDTVNWSIGPNHDVVEVDSVNWANNANTSNGGFSLPLGGGTQVFNTVGTIYYVCSPHASSGMKGLITVIAPSLQMDLPLSFDDAAVNYSVLDFSGNTSSIVADPTNPANMVVRTDKSNTAQFWAGTTLAVLGTPPGSPNDIAFASAIPFSVGNTQMTVRVYSPDAGIPVRLKLEDANDATHTVETEALTTVANTWETLTFDFSNEATGTAIIDYTYTYDKASIFFNFGTNGAIAGAKTYYWDDVEFVGGGLTQMDLPLSFDDVTVNYSVLDFSGNTSSIVADPTNPANMVVRTDKSNTAQFWAGTTLAVLGTPPGSPNDIAFASAIPFSVGNTQMTVRVYSPDVGIPVRLRMEDATDATHTVETEALTTVANTWETLTFDFSNEATGTAIIDYTYTYDKASIMFNFGVNGATAGAKTYYWDDVEFVGGGLTQMDLPLSFDDVTVNYSVLDFSGNTSSIVADPTNPANMVVRTDKSNTAQFWAGTTLAVLGTPPGSPNDIAFASAIPLSVGNTKMTVKVYSPDAGIPVRLRIEDATDATHTVETEALTTVANTWETLTFDFSNEVTGTALIDYTYTYDKASIMFNFGVNGATAGAKTYYWDDVKFVGAGLVPMDLPISFDDVTVNYSVLDFSGNASSFVADPTNPANMVVRTDKSNTAQFSAGTTLAVPGSPHDVGLASAIPISVGNTKMTVRVYSPDAGIPVRLRIEDATDATHTVETEVLTTVANTWETLIFDFNNEVTGTTFINYTYTYDKASIFFNFGTSGATAGAKTYYWDDLEFLIVPLVQMDLPVTFNDTSIYSYGTRDFGGTVSTFASDPAGGTNKVVKTTKNGPQVFAGTTLATPSAPYELGFNSALAFTPCNTQMTVRVYSPTVGIPVRLKVEDAINSAITVETETMTTKANAWEVMNFDFSNQVAGTSVLNLANTYDKASIFFDFGTVGTGQVYYWDDLQFVTEYTWNGDVSTDWNDGKNWDEGTVPSDCADITIPDVSLTSGNNPIINPMVTLGDITVAANASVEINEGIVLDGTFTNNGSVTLKSTATSTAYLDDFTNAGASYIGDITVERFVTPGFGLGQRLFGSAVSSSIVSGLDMTYASATLVGDYVIPDVCGESLMAGSVYSNLFQFEQANVPAGGCDQLGWFAMNPSSILTPGRGYSGWMNDGTVISVTGPPNTGNVDFITSGSSGSGVVTADGWHLLSNPYPSPLNVDAYISSGYTSPVTYDGSSGPYNGTFNPVLLSGNELAIMQGFYAENTGVSATATVTNTDRIASNTSAWFNSSSLLNQMLTINVIGNGFADKTNIFYKDHNLVTNEFDDYTDCKKRSSNLGQPTIYFTLNDDRMAIVGFPTSELSNSVPFGVEHGADGNFELTFEGMSDFPVNTTIYIEDKHLGVYHNIANGNYAYNALASDDSDRFELHFVLAVEITTVDVNCNGDNGKIQLSSTEGIANRDFIISELNNLIASGSLNTLDVEVQVGTYTVVVNDAFGGSQTYDVIVEEMDQIEADFTLSETAIKVGDLVVLENKTTNANIINWEVDGEHISEASNLSYSFVEAGIYDISLQVVNDDCQDVKTETVTVSSKTTSILNLSNGQSVSMNSVSNSIIIDFVNLEEENAILTVFNLLGQNILSKTLDADTRQSVSLDKLSSGYYLVQLNISGEVLRTKVLIENKN